MIILIILDILLRYDAFKFSFGYLRSFQTKFVFFLGTKEGELPDGVLAMTAARHQSSHLTLGLGENNLVTKGVRSKA